MKTLKLTPAELSVLRQALDSVGWDALPKDHPDRKAADSLRRKLAAEIQPTEAA